jgi:SAM-dependent methyltransferase
MNIAEWNERYRTRERPGDFTAAPTPLLVDTAQHLTPGRALDLACGTGRHALWLAAQGWSAEAVDGSEVAVAALRSKAVQLGVTVDASVADLASPGFRMEESRYHLVLMCYYLQRDLFSTLKNAIVPGGLALVIVHIVEPGEEPTPTRAVPGELPSYFSDWEILHRYEGPSRDPAHHRAVAEIVARRPA